MVMCDPGVEHVSYSYSKEVEPKVPAAIFHHVSASTQNPGKTPNPAVTRNAHIGEIAEALVAGKTIQ